MMILRFVVRTAATLTGTWGAVFSKTAGLRTRPRELHAGGDPTPHGGGRMGGTVGRRREPEGAPEARRERADAAQPDREADLHDGAVGVAQQRGSALEPARPEVLVRRLAEDAPELGTECAGERCAARASEGTSSGSR